MAVWDLRKRTFLLAIETARMIDALPRNRVNNACADQLIRCSSSIGANYRAARRAKSGSDFLYKLKIVEEETDETIYFLEILQVFNPTFEASIKALVQESNEILRIIVSAIIKIRSKAEQKSK